MGIAVKQAQLTTNLLFFKGTLADSKEPRAPQAPRYVRLRTGHASGGVEGDLQPFGDPV